MWKATPSRMGPLSGSGTTSTRALRSGSSRTAGAAPSTSKVWAVASSCTSMATRRMSGHTSCSRSIRWPIPRSGRCSRRRRPRRSRRSPSRRCAARARSKPCVARGPRSGAARGSSGAPGGWPTTTAACRTGAAAERSCGRSFSPRPRPRPRRPLRGTSSRWGCLRACTLGTPGCRGWRRKAGRWRTTGRPAASAAARPSAARTSASGLMAAATCRRRTPSRH
mmetsp:Transcript_31314/g.104032  ORF Transcript_31314/g.104032 Transcript_31314/m.104032 type:complete len:223 (-) Transcript_31314:482-1150(-)